MQRPVNPFFILLSCLIASALWACQPSGSEQGVPASRSTDSSQHHSDSGDEDTAGPATNAPVKEKEKEMYENTNRMVWQKPDLVIDMMGDLENKTVADIGAGTGFFAKRLAENAEKVIAIDIDQRFLNYIDSIKVLEMPAAQQQRLETRLAEPDNPMLKPGEADVILIVNTFMYIRNKESYLATLKQSLTEDGQLFIIDFKKKRTDIGPPSDIRLPLFQIEQMLYDAGYRNIDANDTALDYQYIIRAQK